MPRVHYYQHEMEQLGFKPASYGVFHHHFAAVEPQLLQLQHYLRYSEPLELTACPLDLSVKTQAPITPPCTPSPERKKIPDVVVAQLTPKTAPSTQPDQPTKRLRPSGTPSKRAKAARRLNFDEDKSSPVSGTIIRELGPDETLVVRKGDIDPAFNVVEITDEAKAELAKIDNQIGDYVCRLCRELYEDAFGLAQHRCSRIVHVEYRCPECDKVFNCPANLASHRRWHKPRPPKQPPPVKLAPTTQDEESPDGVEPSEPTAEPFPCRVCGKQFRRLAYLRKHQITHQESPALDVMPQEKTAE